MVQAIVGMMGGHPFVTSGAISEADGVRAFLDATRKHRSVTAIDTARVYGGGKSEELLGQVNASKRFAIHTKIICNPAQPGGTLSRESIQTSARQSFAALRVEAVDVLYLHRPDPETPLEETLEAMDELYKRHAFKRLGISNYTAADVDAIVTICERNGYVKPTVYQGVYNGIARRAQEDLFPTLRRHGIAMYAWGPLASGLLAKPLDVFLDSTSTTSRYNTLPVAKEMLGKEEIFEAVRGLHAACAKAEVSIMEASLAWLKYHAGLGDEDAVLLGASKLEQLEANLEAWDRAHALAPGLVDAFDSMWARVKEVAPGYA